MFWPPSVEVPRSLRTICGCRSARRGCPGSGALDGQRREVEVDNHLLQPRARLEVDLQHLGLAVGVDRHVEDFAPRRPLRDVVLLVARDALDGAALHHDGAVLAVAVEDVVDGPLVVALEDADVVDALVEEGLVGDLRDDVAAVPREDNHVVDVRAVADELGILHRLADAEESLSAVDVELGVGHRHARRLNRVELAQLGAALLPLAVLLTDVLVVGHGILRQVGQVVARLVDVGLNLADFVVGLLGIVARDADELQLRQALHVLERHLAAQLLLEGLQPLVDGGVGLLAAAAPLDELVELVLDEIRSSEAACHASFSSPRRISSSRPSSQRVCSAERRRISDTPRKWGLSSQMTQAFGAIETSQSVKA